MGVIKTITLWLIKRLRVFLGLILAGAAFFWFAWLFCTSSEFSSCVHKMKDYKAYYALHEERGFVLEAFTRFHLSSVCTVHTVNAFSGSFAAVAGLVVAGFTFALWWSTEKLWRSAEVQLAANEAMRKEDVIRLNESLIIARETAEAALMQARVAQAQLRGDVARIAIVSIDLVKPATSTTSQPEIIPPGPIEEESYRISILFQSIGKTTSTIIELCIEWELVKRTSSTLNPDLGVTNAYVNIDRRNIIFHPNQPLRINFNLGDAIILSPSELAQIAANDLWLWTYGYFKYSDIIDTYTVGFAAHWEAVPNSTFPRTSFTEARGFVLEGPPVYFFSERKV